MTAITHTLLNMSIERERTDLLETLAKHRFFLRYTLRELTQEQAARSPTASALCLGGLIKHVAATEKAWLAFICGGADGMAASAQDEDREQQFRMLDGDTVESVLKNYEDVANKTTETVNGLQDLDASHPLPTAPWFEPGASWSARRVLLHMIAETAQHAGHADILRESLDGARTMG